MDKETLRKNFDAARYFKKYPDVAASGLDPFEHYFEVGKFLGREKPAESISGKKRNNAPTNLHHYPSSVSLFDFGYTFLSPILSDYFKKLLSSSLEDTLPVCLAREGHLLQRILLQLAENGFVDFPHKPIYLKVSRSLLFRSMIDSDKSRDEILCSSYAGSFSQLLHDRFGLGVRWLHSNVSESEALLPIRLPDDKQIVEKLLDKHMLSIVNETSKTNQAFKNYLLSVGLYASQKKPLFLDLGYSGTIQKLLTRLLQRSTSGIYIFASQPGDHVLGNFTASMRGTFKEGLKIGDGYLPLERTLFFESLLTAPHGQVKDIVEIEPGKFEFNYGVLVAGQKYIHFLKEIHEGAIAGVVESFHNKIEWSHSELENLLTAQLSSPWSIPRGLHDFFSSDDSVCGNAIVNPISLFKMGL